MPTTGQLSENSRQGFEVENAACIGLESRLSQISHWGCGHVYDETPVGIAVYVRNDPINFVDPDGRQIQHTVPAGEYGPGFWNGPSMTFSSVDSEGFWSVGGPNPASLGNPSGSGAPGGGGSGAAGSGIRLSYSQIAALVSAYNLSGQSNEMIICIACRETRFKAGVKSSTTTASGLMGVTKRALKDTYPKMTQQEIEVS